MKKFEHFLLLETGNGVAQASEAITWRWVSHLPLGFGFLRALEVTTERAWGGKQSVPFRYHVCIPGLPKCPKQWPSSPNKESKAHDVEHFGASGLPGILQG